MDATIWACSHVTDLASGPGPLPLGDGCAGVTLVSVATAEPHPRAPIASPVLTCLMTDVDRDTPSHQDDGTDLGLTWQDMLWFFDTDVSAAVRNDAKLNPAARRDLSGLPSACVANAEYDMLRDEGEADCALGVIAVACIEGATA